MTTGVFKMRRWVVLGFLLSATVAACGPSEPPIGANPKAYDSAAPAGPPAFIGRWGAESKGCDRDIWLIGSDGLRSPSELSCTFESIDTTSAGYIVSAMCRVGKAVQPSRIVFTMTGPAAAQSLTMTGGPFAEPVALSRCPSSATVTPASLSVSTAP